MKIQNPKSKIQSFLFLAVVFSFSFLVFRFVSADVPVREQQVENCRGSLSGVCFPVWVHQFDKCTEYQTSLEKFIGGVTLKTSELEYKASRRAQMRDIQKAREDVNKLVATVYNELRTQQIALNYGELRDTLQSLGIVVSDDNSEEICKASYHVKAKIGDDEQCVAVAQEARIITNSDDFIYEESRRRAMDALFCYLGDWRHFPIAKVNDPANCEALELPKNCTAEEIWKTLNLTDADGNATPIDIGDDQHIYNLCENIRAKGKKCAQDSLRDFIKYSTIDKITRKDRTIILAPPATWYTPTRCQIIESVLPVSSQPTIKFKPGTPYTKRIKSLEVTDPDKLNSLEFLNYYTGSKFGSPTLPMLPSDMDGAQYTIEKELQAFNIPENSFSGLAAKTETLANQIITEMTDLRKLQYTSGEGLRDATLRIGWQDYNWDADGKFLEKYNALDSPPTDPKRPNKIYEPLPCYWKNESLALSALCDATNAGAEANDKTFYFDTGIVISPISITKSKLEAAIKAQFDLAQKAFSDDASSDAASLSFGECGIDFARPDYSLHSLLPAPWEDTGVNLASAFNPLTGDSYVTGGLPNKDNISYSIPNLPNNYFNVIYNDIFQLYHTSVPDVLAEWFTLNVPEYNSIYGAGEPIDILEKRVAHTFSDDPKKDDDEPPNPLEPPPPPPPPGSIPGCNNYHQKFQDIGKERGVDGCFLEAISVGETSNCNPNAENIGDGNYSCGIMQVEVGNVPGNEEKSVKCAKLKSDVDLSIRLAADLFLRYKNIIGNYKSRHGYDIGDNYSLSDRQDNYDSRFNGGNDDLIASYNAGAGDRLEKYPFNPSNDCKSGPIPAWQCPIEPGEFVWTQRYVQRVQAYQKGCAP